MILERLFSFCAFKQTSRDVNILCNVSLEGRGTYFAGLSNGKVLGWQKRGLVEQKAIWEPAITIDAHLGAVRCLFGSAAFRYVASGSSDRTVKIWDPFPQLQRSVEPLRRDRSLSVSDAGMSSTSSTVGISSSVARLQRVHLVQTLVGHGGTITAIAADENHLFTASRDGEIRIWKQDSKRNILYYPWYSCSQTISLGSEIWVSCMEVAEVGRQSAKSLFLGDSEGTLQVYKPVISKPFSTDPDSIECFELDKTYSHVHKLGISHVVGISQEKTIFSAGYDKGIRGYSTMNNKVFFRHDGTVTHVGETSTRVAGLAWNQAHRDLVVVDTGGGVCVFDPSTGRNLFETKLPAPTHTSKGGKKKRIHPRRASSDAKVVFQTMLYDKKERIRPHQKRSKEAMRQVISSAVTKSALPVNAASSVSFEDDGTIQISRPECVERYRLVRQRRVANLRGHTGPVIKVMLVEIPRPGRDGNVWKTLEGRKELGRNDRNTSVGAIINSRSTILNRPLPGPGEGKPPRDPNQPHPLAHQGSTMSIASEATVFSEVTDGSTTEAPSRFSEASGTDSRASGRPSTTQGSRGLPPGYSPTRELAAMLKSRGRVQTSKPGSRGSLQSAYPGSDIQSLIYNVGHHHTPSSEVIYSVGLDNTIRAWNPIDMTSVRMWKSEDAELSAFTFMEHLEIAVTGHEDGTIRLWNLDTGTKHIMNRHSNTVTCLVTVLRNGKQLLVSGSYDGKVIVWAISPPSILKENATHTLKVIDSMPCEVLCLLFSPVTHSFVAGGNDGHLIAYDINDYEQSGVFEGHTDGVIALCRDGYFVMSSSEDLSIKVWDSHSFDCLHTLRGHLRPASDICVVPDTGQLVSCSVDGTIKIWNYSTGDILRNIQHESPLLSMSYRADTGQLYVGTESSEIMIFGIHTGRKEAKEYVDSDDEDATLPDG